MPDIFDKIGAEQRGDVFDRVAQEPTKKRGFRVLENAKNFGLGILKGAGSTAFNLGSLADRGGRALARGAGFDVDPQAEAFTGANPITDALEAQGGWQGAGKATEQVGEFFVPGAAQAGKLAPLAKLAGKAGLFGKVGMEAANAAGVTAAQGGDASTAAIGAGATVPVAAAVGKAAPKIANTLLGPKKTQFMTGANPGRGVAESGIMAGSMESLVKKIDAEMGSVGGEIGKVLGLSPAGRTPSIDVTTLIDGPIADAQKALNATGNAGSANRLAELRAGLYDAFTQMGASPNAVTPAQAFTVKKLIDKAVKMTPSEGAEASVKEVTKAIRRNFAQSIEAAVPEVAPHNRRFADLAEASDAAWDKLNMSMSQKLLTSRPWLAGGGAGLAYWFSHPAVAAAILGTRAAMNITPTATTMAQAARAVGTKAGQGALAKGAGAGLSAMTNPDPKEEYLRKLIAGER